MSFLAEIRRRKVFQVAAVYAVVAWLIVQVVSTIEQPLNLPEWFAAVVIVSLAIGFPVALILAWAFDITPEGVRPAADRSLAEAVSPGRSQRVGYFMQTLVLFAVGFLVLDQYLLNQSSDPTSTASANTLSTETTPTRRYELNLGDTGVLGNSQLQVHPALSRDGRYLVYAARFQGTAQLYLRALDRFEVIRLSGTDGAYHPFTSPTGDWVGFYSDETDSKLKKVAIRGGSAQTLAGAVFAAGGTWADDDSIFFSTRDETGGRSLYRVSAGGGEAELILESNEQEGYVTPEAIPGSDNILVVVRPGPGGGGNAREGNIAVYSASTGGLRTLIRGGFRPKFAPSGHVVFVRDSDLWAVPFDSDELVTIGPESLVVQNVQQGGYEGGAAYTFSDDGVLMYVPGGEVSSGASIRRSLIWVDRQGNVELVTAEQNRYSHPRISPDGRYLALTITGTTGSDIWTYDLTRDTFNRLTFDGADHPIWSEDGARVAFTSLVSPAHIAWRAASGSGQAESLSLPFSGNTSDPLTFSPGGNELIVQSCETGPCYLGRISIGGGGDIRPLADEIYSVNDATISPDGRWIAYGSNETGREEVFIQPFPDLDSGGKWQISRDGGAEPRWGPSGDELFYRSGTAVVAVSVETEPQFLVGRREVLFQDSRYAFGSNVQGRPSYDVTPDGQHFVLLRTETGTEAEEEYRGTRMIVVDNWFEELKRLAPAN